MLQVVGLFVTNAGSLTLNNSTVSGNYAFDGGGVANLGSTLVIASSTITNNTAYDDSGGIDNDGGYLTLTNSMVTANITLSGDGAGVRSSESTTLGTQATAMISNSTISHNTAGDDAGGMQSVGYSMVTIADSTISGNRSSDDAGGIENEVGTTIITNCDVTNNTAAYGGGVYTYQGMLNISGSTISGNSATADGGGAYVYTGTMILENSTINGNMASDDGGGIQKHGRRRYDHKQYDFE